MTAVSPSEPTMLFCLGANKAGTSWLYRYLAGHPECRMPVVKELHYFDAVHFKRLKFEQGRIAALRDAKREQATTATAQTAILLAAEIAELDDWLLVLTDAVAAGRGDEAYRQFLLSRAGGARLVGDVTPAYALLPEVVLARMQALAPQVRFLFILRDPVDRLWSNIRMNAARAAQGTEAIAAEALRMFDAWVCGGESPVRKRSDYAATVRRLAQVVDPAKLSYMFFETMFTRPAMDRLCRFLGISPFPARLLKPVHVGMPVALDPARQIRARAILAPQYDFIRQTIGDLPPRWRENMGEM